MLKLPAACAALSIAALPAIGLADVRVSFEESAPKDRFSIRNSSACESGPMTVTIDLAGSKAGLIFDTTGSGAGVSVYQPFELVAGADRVVSVTGLTDGDTQVTLSLTGLDAGETAAFTIDVDDTLTAGPLGQTMIAGSEIAGARVRVTMGGGSPVQGTFSTAGTAKVAVEACVS